MLGLTIINQHLIADRFISFDGIKHLVSAASENAPVLGESMVSRRGILQIIVPYQDRSGQYHRLVR